MSAGLLARLALRESRGSRGRLAFFALCLAVGVAAVVAVAGLSQGLERGIREQARPLLAADLMIESRRPLPPEIDGFLEEFEGARRTDVRETNTVVAAATSSGGPGSSLLSELKVVEGAYPFYGELDLEPDRPLSELLTPETAVVGPDLLDRLRIGVGDRLRVGEAEFRIAGVVRAEPDRVRVSLALGPRVFLSGAGFERAALERFGSRIEYRALVRLPDDTPVAEVKRLAVELREGLPEPEYLRVETYAEAQPGLRDGIRRVDQYLGLVALLSLLIGGVGVAQVVRAWLAGRLDALAVMRCLGVRPVEALVLYLGQTAALGFLGSAAGAAVGLALQAAAPALLRDFLPQGVTLDWQPVTALRGLALGTGVAMLFAVPTLARFLRVPPARVFRRDAEPLAAPRGSRVALVAVLAAGLSGVAVLQAGSVVRGLGFVAGLAVAVAALGGAAALLTAGIAALQRTHGPLWLRHGVGALVRPGASTLGAIVALGVGILVVLAMYLVQYGLARQLDADLPAGAPTVFLIDIQPDQWDGVRALLDEAGAEDTTSVPVVVARLREVDGRPVREILAAGGDDPERRWVFTREQRLSYMEKLPDDNRILRGELWADPQREEVSIERDFARDLGVDVGSTLRFDVQGRPLELAVTSIREVDWTSFGINFFLVVEPGVLERAPQFRVAATRAPAGGEQRLQDALSSSYPNVTLLRVREILEKVVAVLGQVGLGVRLLGGFTVLAGLAILAGAVGADAVRRGREVALLKTLGMTRWGVAATFSVEYALVGLVAGAVGTVGGAVLSWAVLTQGMDLRFDTDLRAYPLAVVAAPLLTVAAGLAASARALLRRPMDVLREE